MGEPKVLYSKGGVVVRESRLEDILILRNTLMPEHVAEVSASHGLSPEHALMVSYLVSETCLTGLKDGVPVCMFGVSSAHASEPGRGVVWLLGSSVILEIPKTFLKLSRLFMRLFLERYTFLENYADARFVRSLSWLEWLGAKVDTPTDYGNQGFKFCHFEMKGGARNV